MKEEMTLMKALSFNFYIFVIAIITLLFGTALSGIGRNCNEGKDLLRDNIVGNFFRIGFNQTCNKENSFKKPEIDLRSECINYISNIK